MNMSLKNLPSAKRLWARMESNNGVKWNVDINGVFVGTMADPVSAEIQWKAETDWRLYLGQAYDAIRTAFTIVKIAASVFPSLVFWVFLLVGLLSPELLVGTAANLLQPDSAEKIHHLAGRFVFFFTLFVSVTLVLYANLWCWSGSTVINLVDESIKKNICELFEIPWPAHVRVYPTVLDEGREGDHS